jgi:hypothetical protein
MSETIVYHSPIKLPPKKRLQRICDGLVYEMRKRYPLLSVEEARLGIGLAIAHNRELLITAAKS